MKKLLLTGLMFVALTTTAFAQDFLLGEETKGFKVKISDDTDINFRVRFQPRLDIGDLTKDEDGKSYESESDMYIRRARLEVTGQLYKNLKYNLTFEADKWGQTKYDDKVGLLYIYLDYKFNDAFGVRAGKAKLPYSRISLTSSSEQLLIERPVSTEAAKKFFDDYYQPNLLLYGKFMDGVIAYNLAVGDGWAEDKTITGTTKVHKADPLYIARVELSPPGWVEAKKSDAHLGKGRHLSLGLNYAQQDGIEYKGSPYEEDRNLWGIDMSGHYEGLTAQLEYNQWKEEYTDPSKKDKEPEGWYLQMGYFINGLALEPVARYEVYDQDSNSPDKEERITSLGMNWYPKGHSLKVGVNWAHYKYDRNASGWLANDDEKDVFQIQAQLYF